MELTRESVEFRADDAQGALAVSAAAPYRSPLPAGRDGFLQLLHAEWTKFRTVRGWVVGTAVGALMIVVMAALTGSFSHSEVCVAKNGGPPTCHTAHQRIPDRAERRARDRPVLARPSVVARQRQHHRPRHVADRPLLAQRDRAGAAGGATLRRTWSAACSHGRRPA